MFSEFTIFSPKPLSSSSGDWFWFLSGAVMGRPEGLARPPLVSAMAFSFLALSFLCTGVSSLPQPLPRVFLSFEGKKKILINLIVMIIFWCDEAKLMLSLYIITEWNRTHLGSLATMLEDLFSCLFLFDGSEFETFSSI